MKTLCLFLLPVLCAGADAPSGVDSLIHPDLIPSLLKSGRNEIGIHGWIHEYTPGLDSEAEEERLFDKAIARIRSLTGKQPLGYRAPSWAFSPYTMDLVRKKGKGKSVRNRIMHCYEAIFRVNNFFQSQVDAT